MENFDIFKADDNLFEMVVVMKICEAPLEYLSEISDSLKSINFKGFIAIDQMLHSGNTGERFIVAFFDGLQFQKDSFEFRNVSRRSAVRKYICDMLRTDPEVIALTILNEAQKRLISKGCYI